MSTSAVSLARNAVNGCPLNSAFHGIAAGELKSSNAGSNQTLHVQPTHATHPTAVEFATQTTAKGKRIDVAAQIIAQSHIVCLDVDSTVIKEEGIDELAHFCNKGAEVARVTKEAMGGAMTFQDALTIRLNIIRPTQAQIANFVRLCPSTLTRNVRRFVHHLLTEGKQVYLISGGFDCLIEPIANILGISMSNVFANKLLFHDNGDYAGFDTTQPTSKSGGKAEAIALIKQRNASGALITMIGDGATDLEAVPPANYFIGFGGNVMRKEVYHRAQYFITDFEQLLL